MAANFKLISSLLNIWKFEPPVFLVLPKIQPWSVLIMFLDFREFQPYVLKNVVLIKKNGVYKRVYSVLCCRPFRMWRGFHFYRTLQWGKAAPDDGRWDGVTPSAVSSLAVQHLQPNFCCFCRMQFIHLPFTSFAVDTFAVHLFCSSDFCCFTKAAEDICSCTFAVQDPCRWLLLQLHICSWPHLPFTHSEAHICYLIWIAHIGCSTFAVKQAGWIFGLGCFREH